MNLQDYPRPKNDNGIGLHFRLDLRETDNKPYLTQGVEWLQEINAKWTLIAGQDWQQIGKAARMCWDAGIMPISRLICKIDRPFIDWETGVKVLHDLGIPAYIQVFNEPSDYREWSDGNADLARFGDKWGDAAWRVYQTGGMPGMAAVLGEDEWLVAYNAVQAAGLSELWQKAWFCVHNYGSNHPPNYPYDDVNQNGTACTPEEYAKYRFAKPLDELNELRKTSAHPGETIYNDDTSVLRVVAFKKWMTDSLGYCLPMLGGEGGWQWQTEEDLRYPKLPDEFHAQYTREIFEWFRTNKLSDGSPLPDELFCNVPWIQSDWGADDWWFGALGTKQGTIDAVKSIPTFTRKFSWDAPTAALPSEPALPPAQPIEVGLPPAIETPAPILTDPNLTQPVPDLETNVPIEPEPLPVLEPPTEPAQPPSITYTVQQGETLWGIAKKFGTTVDALMQANDISDRNKIRAGQKLTIPR